MRGENRRKRPIGSDFFFFLRPAISFLPSFFFPLALSFYRLPSHGGGSIASSIRLHMRAKQTKPLNTRLLLEIRSAESRHGCVVSYTRVSRRKRPNEAAETARAFHRRGRNAGNTAKVVLFFLLFLFPSSARNSPEPSQLAAEFGIHGGRRVAGDNFLARVPSSPRFGRNEGKVQRTTTCETRFEATCEIREIEASSI